MRPNLNLMKATLTGALGGLLFGFDTVVISGRHRRAGQALPPEPPGQGLDGGYRANRHGSGSPGRRPGGAKAGRPRDAAHHRRALCGFRHRQRAGLELAGADALSLCRGAGHRRFIGAGAGLHCRACPGEVARPPGGRFPVQRGLRHPGGLHLELPHPLAAPGLSGMALAGGHCRTAGLRLPGASVQHSPQPALVGFQGARRRGPRSADADGRAESRGRVGRYSVRPGRGARHRPRAGLSEEVHLSALPGHLHRRIQPTGRHQRDPLLPEQHLCRRPASARSPATSRPSPSASPICCLPLSA